MKIGLFAALLLSSPVLASAQGDDPQALMAQLEARLLAARRVTIDAVIEARGAVAVQLAGRTELRDRNRASLAYAGAFGGQAAELVLQSDGRYVRLRNGGDEGWERTARELNRALVLGWTRMGQLHNLARLAGVQGPDHARGGVDPWVTLDAFRPVTYALAGEHAGLMSFGFDVVVEGDVRARARLWLDPDTGVPRARHVTVRFADGEMQVVERYTRFEVE